MAALTLLLRRNATQSNHFVRTLFGEQTRHKSECEIGASVVCDRYAGVLLQDSSPMGDEFQTA